MSVATAFLERRWSAEGAEYVFRPAWRLDDPQITAAAIGYWERAKMLPASTLPAERARQLVATAWSGDEMVGIATADIERLDQMRANFAMFRCSVSREHRRSGVARQLTVYSRDVLEAWSAANPEEGLMGMATVMETDNPHKWRPVLRSTQLSLIGYTTKGEQLRAVWFTHAVAE